MVQVLGCPLLVEPAGEENHPQLVTGPLALVEGDARWVASDGGAVLLLPGQIAGPADDDLFPPAGDEVVHHLLPDLMAGLPHAVAGLVGRDRCRAQVVGLLPGQAAGGREPADDILDVLRGGIVQEPPRGVVASTPALPSSHGPQSATWTESLGASRTQALDAPSGPGQQQRLDI